MECRREIHMDAHWNYVSEKSADWFNGYCVNIDLS
jgi:hypothetical protein